MFLLQLSKKSAVAPNEKRYELNNIDSKSPSTYLINLIYLPNPTVKNVFNPESLAHTNCPLLVCLS